MHAIWIITKKELATFFDSLQAYILLVVFLGLSGFFTWLYGNDVFLVGQASLNAFFGIAYWTLFFFIPAITMRMIAEENKSGTIELLITKAVSDGQIVVGKYLSCLLLIIIALLCTAPYYITVANLGPVDHGSMIGGYLGMILMSSAYIGIGLFASSISNNQIVSFLIALFIGAFFQILFDVMADNFTGTIALILSYLSLGSHFESISRGVIDTKDVLYFVSVTAIGLILSQIILSKRNWID